MDPKLSLCQQGYPICWMLLFSAGSLSGLGLLHTVWERNIDSPVGSIVVLLLKKQEVLGLGLLPDGHYTDKAKGYWKNEEREEVWEYQKRGVWNTLSWVREGTLEKLQWCCIKDMTAIGRKLLPKHKYKTGENQN